MDTKVWDRISESYFDEINARFQAKVVSPLLDFVDALPGRENLTVADLGCGIGNQEDGDIRFPANPGCGTGLCGQLCPPGGRKASG